MACGSCGKKAALAKSKKVATETNVTSQFIPSTETKDNTTLPMAEKSTSDKKVKVRFLGGGYSASGSGCRSCGGSGTTYKFLTSKRIQFVSEDSPDGWFNQLFTVGRDYYVTEKQAEYLLTLTYTSKAGRKANMFEEVE